MAFMEDALKKSTKSHGNMVKWLNGEEAPEVLQTRSYRLNLNLNKESANKKL
jgi:hypothetical protein